MLRTVLVAFDGSPCSRRALGCAAAVCARFGASLWLVHVVPQTSDLRGYADFEKIYSRRRAAGQALLDEARRQVGTAAAEVHEALAEGAEAEGILECARRCGAGLIVVGSRGLGTLKGLVVGSVSRKVLHHATCPVLVVR